MSDDNTKVESDTSESDGKNTDATTGAGTDNSKQDNQEKTLTQSEVNDIVKRAKLDAERAAKTKFDKSLEGKHILTDEERDALIKDAVTAALKEESLKSVRVKIKEEFGLDDYKVGKLEGDDEKSLREDAEKTYGKPKKEPPRINPGTRQQEQDENESRVERMKKQIVRKRDWLD